MRTHFVMMSGAPRGLGGAMAEADLTAHTFAFKSESQFCWLGTHHLKVPRETGRMREASGM